MVQGRRGWGVGSLMAAAMLAPAHGQQAAEGGPTFKCPGNVYTNMITAQEAKARNCTTIEGAPITIVQTAKPRTPAAKPAAEAGQGAAPRASDAKVDPATQRQRDSDSRRILETELKREEEKLAALQKDFNGGQPERRGDEQNFAKYMDRVAEMKAALARKEADIAAIRREIAKLPPSP
jgi:hypothetical protein